MRSSNPLVDGTFVEDGVGRPSADRTWRGTFHTDDERNDLGLLAADLNANTAHDVSVDFGDGPVEVVVTSGGKVTGGVGYDLVIEGFGQLPEMNG